MIRWIALRALQSPAAWGGLVLGWGLWFVLKTLSPIGLTLGTSDGFSQYYEVAFLALLGGTLLGMLVLEDAAELLGLLPARSRTLLRVLALGSAALLGLLATALAPALAFRELGWMNRGVLAGLLVTLAHLTAIAALLERAPLPRGLRAPALPLLAWLVPAAVPASGIGGDLVQVVLGVARHLVPEPADPRSLALALLPIAGLLAAAALWDQGTEPSRADLRQAPRERCAGLGAARDEVRDPG